MKNSHIAWTDHTCNPIIVKGGGFYCVKVSEGCKNCYAEKVNKRICGFKHVPAYDYKVVRPIPELELREDMLASWARMGKPCKNFVSSMTDVFGEFVPDEWIFKILDAMVAAPKQIFQVLTKRSKRMRDIVGAYCQSRKLDLLPQNIWLMVSVENQNTVSRAVDLIATPCKVRGLSIEPLLGEVNLLEYQNIVKCVSGGGIIYNYGDQIIRHIDWIIVGGESGPNARPMNPNWVYNLQRQCKVHEVPFFFKQWGEWVGAQLDMNRGKVMIEDGGIFWLNAGHPKVHDWKEDAVNGIHRAVSTRVGRNGRVLQWMSEPKETLSDNALLGGFPSGKHYFEFPKYLTSATTNS